MRIVSLPSGALVVNYKDETWLFGAPEGVTSDLQKAGIDTPDKVFTTSLRAPGYTELGKVIRYKESPLKLNGLYALPVHRKHGTDYLIEDQEGNTVYFSERGDVSVSDTQQADVSFIKNKHVANGYTSTVFHWPWPEAEFLLEDSELTNLTKEIRYKVWNSMENVPNNLKSIDETPLTLDQANFIARVAKASNDGPDENWAIGISSFKKTYTKKDGKWVKKDNNTSEKEVVEAELEIEEKMAIPEMMPKKNFGDVLTAALHTAYNDISDHYFSEGYLTQDERMTVANAIGPALKLVREALPSAVMNKDVTLAIPAKLKEELHRVSKELHIPDSISGNNWTTIYKENGEDRWATISSVATWDRQNELFTAEAMDWAIAFNKLIGKKGPLRFKHVPGLDGGECDTQFRVGDFLFEAGFFYDNPIGLAMKERYKEDPNGWMISLGLAYARNDIQNGKYKRAVIFERSMTRVPALPITTFYV